MVKKRGNFLLLIISFILIAGILLTLSFLSNSTKEKQLNLSPETTQTKKTTYIYAGNLLASKTNNEEINYYIQDHLGSNRKILENSQIESDDFYAFGEEKFSNSDNNYKFTGKPLDEETDLYYYGARYYSPELGRFLQADVLRGDIADPTSLNRYVYVQNNPLKYVDPSGNAIVEKNTIVTETDSSFIITYEYIILPSIFKGKFVIRGGKEMTKEEFYEYIFEGIIGKGVIEEEQKREKEEKEKIENLKKEMSNLENEIMSIPSNNLRRSLNIDVRDSLKKGGIGDKELNELAWKIWKMPGKGWEKKFDQDYFFFQFPVFFGTEGILKAIELTKKYDSLEQRYNKLTKKPNPKSKIKQEKPDFKDEHTTDYYPPGP